MSNSTSRRGFLKGAAAAIAAPLIVPASVLGRDPDKPAPSNRLALAMVGARSMGQANYNSFRTLPRIQVAAIADPDDEVRPTLREAIEKDYGGLVAESRDFRDVIHRDDIDLVCVCTPDHWHALITIMAVKAGKDVYCEKPLSLTVEEGRLMADAARRAGAVVQTGSQQRSGSTFRRAIELVRNGRIGQLQRIEVGLPTGPAGSGQVAITDPPKTFDYDMWLGPAPWAPYSKERTHWDFRWIHDYSGGMMTDWGAHNIDIAQWALGFEHSGPRRVSARGQFPTEGIWNTASTFDVELDYGVGVPVLVSTSYTRGVRFIGEEGEIFVQRGTLRTTPESLATAGPRGGEFRLRDTGGHHQNFIDCVASRSRPEADVEIGHRSATTCHLATISMRLGRPIEWDPDAEQPVNDPEAARWMRRPYRAPWRLA